VNLLRHCLFLTSLKRDVGQALCRVKLHVFLYLHLIMMSGEPLVVVDLLQLVQPEVHAEEQALCPPPTGSGDVMTVRSTCHRVPNVELVSNHY
jgi:hypothetical protein